jgi:hypothetical protein
MPWKRASASAPTSPANPGWGVPAMFTREPPDVSRLTQVSLAM